jgi:hypothetical protein
MMKRLVGAAAIVAALVLPFHSSYADRANPPPVDDGSGIGVDGSTVLVSPATAQVLFHGVVPPHGFMVCITTLSGVNGTMVVVNDVGPAEYPIAQQQNSGFLIEQLSTAPYGNLRTFPPCFVTPPGYRPAGPVSAIANAPQTVIFARMW